MHFKSLNIGIQFVVRLGFYLVISIMGGGGYHYLPICHQKSSLFSTCITVLANNTPKTRYTIKRGRGNSANCNVQFIVGRIQVKRAVERGQRIGIMSRKTCSGSVPVARLTFFVQWWVCSASLVQWWESLSNSCVTYSRGLQQGNRS